MGAKDEEARRTGPRKDLLLAPGVGEVVSDYFRYFASATQPLNPQSGEENKAGRPENPEIPQRGKSTPLPENGPTSGYCYR